MELAVYKTDKWFRCPSCLNYSINPMECCGESMIEESDDGVEYAVEGSYLSDR